MERTEERTCIVCGKVFKVVLGNTIWVTVDCETCPGGRRKYKEVVEVNDAKYCTGTCAKAAREGAK